jgi:hypothetical protein
MNILFERSTQLFGICGVLFHVLFEMEGLNCLVEVDAAGGSFIIIILLV